MSSERPSNTVLLVAKIVLFVLLVVAAAYLFRVYLLRRGGGGGGQTPTSSTSQRPPHVSDGTKTLQDSRIGLYSIPNLLTDQECRELIELAHHLGFKPSSVLRGADGQSEVDQRTRSSTSCMLPVHYNHRAVTAVEQRIADLCGAPLDRLEGLQVVRYEAGQRFHAHHDWFSGSQIKDRKQRRFTIFCYLNDLQVGQGGETRFPKLGRAFRPVKGTALFWENCDEKQRCHVLNLHEGLPPLQPGVVKYGLNAWVTF